MPMFGARPHSHDATTNSRMLRDEQAHRAEALRQPAGERHRDRVGDGERGDDPGALRRADAEVAGDRRDRDVGDRRVEHVHEGRERQRDRAEHELGCRAAAALGAAAPRRGGVGAPARKRAAGARGGASARRRRGASSAGGGGRRAARRRDGRRRRAVAAARSATAATAPAEVGGDDLLHFGVGRSLAASKTLVCARDAALRGVGEHRGRRCCATSTLASIDRPTRSGCSATSFGSSAMRTGTRCTTLIQLPVAFCAGSSANAAPVPAPRPSILPW